MVKLSVAPGALLIAATLLLGACVSLDVPPANSAAPTAAATAPTAASPTGAQATPAGEQPAGNLCHIVTVDEVSAVAGLPARYGEDYDLEDLCRWDVGGPTDLGLPFGTVELRRDFSNALDDARELFPDGEEVAVGEEGYWVPLVYTLTFRQNGEIYTVQIGVYDSSVDPRALAIGVATAAAARL